MKRALTFVNAVLLTVFLYGQKIEYTIHLNAGQFFYSGNEARSTTFLNSSLPGNVAEAHANVLTGTRSGFSCNGLVTVQKITENNVVVGLAAGGQSLQSKIRIMEGTDNGAAKGNAYLKNNYINYYLFAGYRFTIKEIRLDAVAGAEGAHLLNSTEKDVVTHPGTDSIFVITQKNVRPDPAFVARIRAQLTAWYRKWGINTGYDYDLSNFYRQQNGISAHGNYISLGLSYKIR